MLNGTAEIANAGNYPNIRLFTVGTATSAVPIVDLQAVRQPWARANNGTSF